MTMEELPMTEDGPPPITRPYRALCIDGGGMRGIYTAAFLDRLLHQYAVIRGEEALDLGKGFDLISGTSTGAILGCAAAVGRPMSEIVRLYDDNGWKIFPHRIKPGILSPIYRIFEGFTGNRFIKWGDRALREALGEQLKDVTMKLVYERRGISLSVPAVSMESHRPWIFNKNVRSGVRDDNYRLADVCLASSAAPIYRSLAAVRNPDHPRPPRRQHLVLPEHFLPFRRPEEIVEYRGGIEVGERHGLACEPWRRSHNFGNRLEAGPCFRQRSGDCVLVSGRAARRL
jgi:hypothetical protein